MPLSDNYCYISSSANTPVFIENGLYRKSEGRIHPEPLGIIQINFSRVLKIAVLGKRTTLTETLEAWCISPQMQDIRTLKSACR